MLIELIENHLRNLPAFQRNHDANVAIRFIADIRNARNRLVYHQVIHPLQQVVLLHLIRNLSDNDLLLRHFAGTRCDAFNDSFGADGDAPSTSSIHRFNPTSADDAACRWEIRTGDVFHEGFGIRFRVFQFAQQRVHYLTEVVRRNARQIPDTYPCRAIEKQIGQ